MAAKMPPAITNIPLANANTTTQSVGIVVNLNISTKMKRPPSDKTYQHSLRGAHSYQNEGPQKLTCLPRGRQLLQNARGEAVILDISHRTSFLQLSIQPVLFNRLVHLLRPDRQGLLQFLPAAQHICFDRAERNIEHARLHHAINHSDSKAKPPIARATEVNLEHA